MAGILASITSSLSWSAKLSIYGQGLERSSDRNKNVSAKPTLQEQHGDAKVLGFGVTTGFL
jgi:hypothetical protein